MTSDDTASDETGFAERLKRKMTDLGWSQSRLAEEAQAAAQEGVTVSRADISGYLSRGTTPRREKLVAIASALGMRPEDLAPADDRRSDRFEMHLLGSGSARLVTDVVLPASLASQIVAMIAETIGKGDGGDDAPDENR